MFTVLIGAVVFGYFLTVTETPQKVTGFITGLGRYGASPRSLRADLTRSGSGSLS